MKTTELSAALSHHFGFTSFREGQESIISAVLEGKDVVGVLPTGGGKSLCFQLPALMRRGVTVVVSPLIALMKDQVDGLASKGIGATFINSSLSYREQQDRLHQVANGRFRLLYVAPERFGNARFTEVLKHIQPSLFVIDEAHCISMWGHDFRPDYQRLGGVLHQFGFPQVMALTATATPEVRDDIAKQLRLGEKDRTRPLQLTHGFLRPELFFAVDNVRGGVDKLRSIVTTLKEHPTGIVYCATRKNVETVTAKLRDVGVRAVAYHAGLDDPARKRTQDRFIQGKANVAVATNAFGMGIDRSDLRAIIHYDIPGSLEAYYQEAGRAGRDGNPALCKLLYNYADVRTQEFFIEGANPSVNTVLAVQRVLLQVCKRGPTRTDAGTVAQRLPKGTNRMAVGTAMRLLKDVGFISEVGGRLGEEPRTVLADTEVDLRERFTEMKRKARRDWIKLKRMLSYVNDRSSCRHKNILAYFGDPNIPTKCTSCDVCAKDTHRDRKGFREPTAPEWEQFRSALECVVRLDGRFGKAKVAQVLAGSRDQGILRLRLNKHKSYGRLKECTLTSIRKILEHLIDEGCLEISGDEYPILRMTQLGGAVLAGQSPLLVPPPLPPQSPQKQTPKPTQNRRPNEPFDSKTSSPNPKKIGEALTRWRASMSKKRGIPPFMILHNATLNDIAESAPRNLDELSMVNGIGPAKCKTYGLQILHVIQSCLPTDKKSD